jgi:ribose-phosphate pyrophosphokinase
MKSKFKVVGQRTVYDFNTTVFSGGEVNVRTTQGREMSNEAQITISASIMDSEGLMTLAMMKDAISREAPETKVTLALWYVPYARQDRVCNPGEALSIKVFCDMINAMKFSYVEILDPHSDVTPALLDNCFVAGPEMVVSLINGRLATKLSRGEIALVAPDAGATKKVAKLAQFYGLEVIQGMKTRDTKTGNLSGFDFMGSVNNKDLLIVDDICDGGGTFLGLADLLKKGGASSISLYVSHGIFSRGVEVLLDGVIDYLYTTDSCNHQQKHERLQVVNWF